MSAALASLAFGCSDDADSSSAGLSDEAMQAFEGIYTLADFTENAAGCDAEGPSMLEAKTDRMFVIQGSSALGQKYLQLASCADEADCRNKAQAITDWGSYSLEYDYTLSGQTSVDDLTGFTSSTGFYEDGICVERTYEDITAHRSADGSLEVRVKTFILEDRPADEDGFCVTDPAKQKQEAAGAPCGMLTVLRGTRTADL